MAIRIDITIIPQSQWRSEPDAAKRIPLHAPVFCLYKTVLDQ